MSELRIVERRDEIHGRNQIIITVYQTPGNSYTYSIQLKVGRIIRSIFPHQVNAAYNSCLNAKRAAFDTVLSWVKSSRTAKKTVFDFELMNVEQQSLFSESDFLQPASPAAKL